MLPDSFKKFLELADIPQSIYDSPEAPRYIRFKPHPDLAKRIALVNEWTPLTNVLWSKNFYAMNSSVKIAQNKHFKAGWFYGIDVSSVIFVKTKGLAVDALQIKNDDHVLDLCCAPGPKMLYISDLMNSGGRSSLGTITGVDISRHRLGTCLGQIRKYKHDRIRLFLQDGTTFDVPPPSRIGPLVLIEPESTASLSDDLTAQIDSPKVTIPFYAPRLIRLDKQTRIQGYLYSKVLVDAECTHDGSMAHIQKFERQNWGNFDRLFLNSERLTTLFQLQCNLLSNGYRMLKDGGLLVYSTCSFSVMQNENVISWFLDEFEGVLEEIPEIQNVPVAPKCSEDPRLRFCVRLDPKSSQTSGFFLARIRKPLAS